MAMNPIFFDYFYPIIEEKWKCKDEKGSRC
jgi:hypothetical protein